MASISPAQVPSLRWIAPGSNAAQPILEVIGFDPARLDSLRRANWPREKWEQLLSVRTEEGNLFHDAEMPAMLGTYHVSAKTIRFEPQFPLEPGMRYQATLWPARMPGQRISDIPPISVPYQLQPLTTVASKVVEQVFPSAAVLPENLLKFYIQFSGPMSRGHSYDHIHLLDEAGKTVELPFLELDEELWNPAMTRLTLFIDPGRIKRGVTPLEEIGPALQDGKHFTLVIDSEWQDENRQPLKESFRKKFQVTRPDREPLDPAQWRIQSPARDSLDPLMLSFPKPMDHALAQRVIRIVNSSGSPVSGKVALEDHDQRWTFVPGEPWQAAAYSILVQTTIEDLAGNNIGKRFEVDLFEDVQRRFTNGAIRLPVEVK